MACNFLLRAQEKVTKEKGTPAVMAFGFLRQSSVITGTRLFGIHASEPLICASRADAPITVSFLSMTKED